MSEVDSSVNSSIPRNAGDILERALRRARWTSFWERLWPPLATLAAAIGVFLAVSWLGLWLWLPPVGRAVALCGFCVLTAAALFCPLPMGGTRVDQLAVDRAGRRTRRPRLLAHAVLCAVAHSRRRDRPVPAAVKNG